MDYKEYIDEFESLKVGLYKHQIEHEKIRKSAHVLKLAKDHTLIRKLKSELDKITESLESANNRILDLDTNKSAPTDIQEICNGLLVNGHTFLSFDYYSIRLKELDSIEERVREGPKQIEYKNNLIKDLKRLAKIEREFYIFENPYLRDENYLSRIEWDRGFIKDIKKKIRFSQIDEVSIIENHCNDVELYFRLCDTIIKTGNKIANYPNIKKEVEEFINLQFIPSLSGFIGYTADTQSSKNKGRTDLVVTESKTNRNILVAEFKIYKSLSTIHASIDQLFNYLHSMDMFTTLIIINRTNKNYERLINNINHKVKSHSLFHKFIGERIKSLSYSYLFNHPLSTKHILLEIIVFNYYSDNG